MTEFEHYDAIANNPHFSNGIKKKAHMLWMLMAAFLTYYFILLVGAAYFRPLFAEILLGNINFGMVFAISQYVVAGAIALYYAHYMKQVDILMQNVLSAHPTL